MNGRFDAATGVAAALAGHARRCPEGVALRFLDEQGVTLLTWRELDAHARAIAATLLARTATGERAVLVYPSGPDYVAAFFGCLYAGVVAVPAYPPESQRSQHLARLRGIFDDAQPALLLTQRSLEANLRQACAEMPRSPAVLATDLALLPEAPAWERPLPDPHCIAFLQYTSGSTATPKGVQVTHGNLAANEAAIREGFAIGADDVIVSWLPLYHDMGLIGGLLQAIYSGIECVLMAPAYFLQRPLRWLQAIADYGGTISGGPDFAYRLCHERVRESAAMELDLRRWRVAFSGAEPIRADTLQGFAERFAASGFSARAFMACYGLAEATLYVSGGAPQGGIEVLELDREALGAQGVKPARAAGEGVSIASCGQVRGGQRLRIVLPEEGVAAGAAQVGEVWVSGPSVAEGYWRNAQATAAAFVERDGVVWLRTGDLGFVQDGQLYLTGRLKDMLIVHGQNLYPQDLEQTIERCVPAVRAGRVAAFASLTEHGEETVGIAAEVSRAELKRQGSPAISQAIALVLAEDYGIQAVQVSLLEPGSLPKTSSGKLQRSACRRLLASGERASLAPLALPEAPALPLDATQHALAQCWAEVLGQAPSRPDAHFFALGGSSLKAMLLVGSLRERFAVAVEVSLVFECPQLADMALWLAAQPRQKQLRARLLPRPAGSAPVLSAAQAQLWFLWKLDPQAVAYNISGQVRWRGRLDLAALEAALTALLQRHEVLRTRFPEVAGRPQPQVCALASLSVRVHDLRDRAPAEVEAEAERLALTAAHQPFDLAGELLLRAQLTQLPQERLSLQLTLHHIVADGASMNRLIAELGELYAAVLEQRNPRLPTLAVQYADHAAWQQAWLAAGEGERQLAYWRARLGDEHSLLALPTDRPRPPVQDFAGGEQRLTLPPLLLERLRALAAEQRTTLPMVLLASFKLLLCRYSGQADLRVGTTVAGRNRPEVEALLGLFVNLLVLRSQVCLEQPFTALLREVGHSLREAQAHQDLPFEQLVEALQPERNLGHNPLFQVAFDHQWPSLEGLGQWPGLTLEGVEHFQRHTQFDLTLHTLESAAGLSANFTYRQDLFDAVSIKRLAGYWQHLLWSIVEQPAQPMARLPWYAHKQGASWLARCNPMPSRLPAFVETTLHERIAVQARRTPDAIAVTCEGTQLSYAQLDRQANGLAWRLREEGVGPDVLVGVAMERSTQLIVALLAVLKAGGAYLPLDPSYPVERLGYLCQDSGVALLLSDAEASLPWAEGLLRLCPSEVPARDDAPPGVTQADHLAYVIYTSGSTGQPKGVAITHRNVVRLFESSAAHFDFGPRDVWSLFHAYAFDFSVWEIFGALLHGGRLVVVPYLTSRDPRAVYTLLCREGVTVLNQTPSAFRSLIPDALASAEVPQLRFVVFGGEALELSMLRPWLQRFGQQPSLINMYGITETTVHVTFRALGEADLSLVDSPIGIPLADLRWYLLDAQGEPVPPGVIGELYIGGPGLARGYLGRPGLTAERFVASPFGTGERLYRTGDLARFDDQGAMFYAGRLDQQVKIRGFRIELGEIEAALYAQAGVREAVVRVRQQQGQAHLAAYVVPDPAALRVERDADEEGEAERVAQWSSVFDGIYALQGAGPSFIGWNDSYADQPIPAAQMQEWLDATVARILALQPRRLLEIGCGVGLLTQHLAPRCAQYRGTDLSQRAVAELAAWCARQPALAHVQLSQQPAIDFSGIEPGSYDTVVINSVAQYFPDVDYLVQVLEGAFNALHPGGRVFLGDLRLLGLLPTFHAALQLQRASADLPLADLPLRIERGVAEDAELLLAPGFFRALRERLPRLGGCTLQLRRGSAPNELTRYRYDAILHLDARLGEPEVSHTWHAEGDELIRLEALLRDQRPSAVRIVQVVNRRLAEERAIVIGLRRPELHRVADLRAWCATQAASGDDPEAYWTLAERHGYRAILSFSEGDEGCFDVFLQDGAAPVTFCTSPPPEDSGHWRGYASDPLLARRRQQFGPRLREALRGRLPAHMVPAHVQVLGRLPLTGNGKLDERQLLALEPLRKTIRGQQAPQGAVERTLAALWAQALELPVVSRDDHFFELGGHSLLATQVVAQINQQLAVQLSLRDFFEATDLAALARRVEALSAAARSDRSMDAELQAALDEIQGLSEHELQALIASATEDLTS